MIKKLKRKFIILATASMLGLMTVLVLIMNLVNYSSVVRESDTVLDMLSNSFPISDGQHIPEDLPKNMDEFMPRGMSPEVPYESRFFSVLISADGTILSSDLSRIVSVDETSVVSYISQVLSDPAGNGFVGQFRFKKIQNDMGIQILFLDCGRKLDSFFLFMWTSIAVGVLGCIIVFLAFLFLSGRIVRPIAESYEKQKRFITDAGHEIKTPLTVINANLDLLEADGIVKEELDDIRQQTERLKTLTQNLVLLSKMEENSSNLQKIDFPVSDLVSETAGTFTALAASQNIFLDMNVETNVTLKGYPDSFRQLVSIIMDNALKYSPENSTISVSMSVQKKYLVLTVKNKSIYPVTDNDLSHIFERFYRTDVSRSSETGGHGIGLSIAKAITESHGGKIQAVTRNGEDFLISVSVPLS